MINSLNILYLILVFKLITFIKYFNSNFILLLTRLIITLLFKIVELMNI